MGRAARIRWNTFVRRVLRNSIAGRKWRTVTYGLITISPEWAETPAYIRAVVRQGVVASIGHTKANSDQIKAAVDAGATMSTHLGNAAHPTLPKTQNYIWDQLADERLTASFIVDGIHIPGVFVHSAHARQRIGA